MEVVLSRCLEHIGGDDGGEGPGVYVDNRLTFSTHIQQKVNIATRMLGYIRHTFKYIDRENFLLLYKSLVRPHLEFASCVWSPHFKCTINALERVQRRATKIVPEVRELPYSERLERLNLETLEFRRKRADLLEVYRLQNNIHTLDQDCHCSLCPGKLMFTKSLSTNTRGHSQKFQIQASTGARMNFFATRSTKSWNTLREETVSSTSLNIFKHNLLKDIEETKFTYTFLKN